MKACGLVVLLLHLSAVGVYAGEPVPSFLPVYVSAPNDSAHLKAAQEAFRKQQIEPCLKALSAAAKELPNLPPARLLLAQMFFNAGDFAHARTVLEEAAYESPSRPEVYLLFAQLASMERRPTDSFVHIEKASLLPVPENWPESQKKKFLAQLCAGRATVAENRRNWPEMQRELEALLKFEPADGVARQRLAYAIFYAELKTAEVSDRDTRVLKHLMQAAADAPSLEPAEVALAFLYASIGNTDRAGKLFKSAVAEHPQDARAYVRLASWELNQNRPVEAGKLASQAAQLGLESRDLKLVRGLVARQLKEYEHAERYFDAIYRDAPGDSEAANQLALALAEQSQTEKQKRALQIAETLVRQFPKSNEALVTLGWVNFKLGRNSQAEHYLRLSTSGGSLQNDAAYFLARVLAEKGSSDDAAKALKILRTMIDSEGSLFVTREEAREWLAKAPPPAETPKEKTAEKAGSPDDLVVPEKKKIGL